jgi:hypothetical protein
MVTWWRMLANHICLAFKMIQERFEHRNKGCDLKLLVIFLVSTINVGLLFHWNEAVESAARREIQNNRGSAEK